jgi:predicted type IV restriction endonuclease
MREFAQVVDDVRAKIRRYQEQELNEQNTKTALIDPVLRALGWDVGDLEQVQQEYRRRPRDKPVDYALLLLRTPRLFVEAKALGQNLHDRRWANQIMGYATLAGVEWVVLTNGDEYRIYNACAPVPIEEKVFRTIRLTDEDSPAEDTLLLLSKDHVSENQIEILWQAQFVDRQIRAALEALFLEPDPSLVRLVRKHVKELSSKDVKASLARVHVQFDFPIEVRSETRDLEKLATGPKERAPRRSKGRFPGRTGELLHLGLRMRDVLPTLIAEGFLSTPLELSAEYRGQTLKARLLADGAVLFRGKRHKSPSGAASHAKGTISGRPMPTDGWAFWHYKNQDGKLVRLDTARQEYLRRKKG